MSQLSASILGQLAAQWQHEKRNQITYEQVASHAEFLGLTGTAAFFGKQAAGEADHAKAVYDFIVARNERAQLPRVEPVDLGTGFREWFPAVMELERGTTEALKAIAASALSEADFQTFYWIADLIKEQTEEENVTQTIIDRMAITQDIHLLDVWIGGL